MRFDDRRAIPRCVPRAGRDPCWFAVETRRSGRQVRFDSTSTDDRPSRRVVRAPPAARRNCTPSAALAEGGDSRIVRLTTIPHNRRPRGALLRHYRPETESKDKHSGKEVKPKSQSTTLDSVHQNSLPTQMCSVPQGIPVFPQQLQAEVLLPIFGYARFCSHVRNLTEFR